MNIKNTQKKKRMFENIYDVVSRTMFEDEARKELDTFLRNKDTEIDLDNDTIKIGKHFTIKLVLHE